MKSTLYNVYNIVKWGILEIFFDENFHFTPTSFNMDSFSERKQREEEEFDREISVWSDEKQEESKKKLKEQHDKYFPDIGGEEFHVDPIEEIHKKIDALIHNSDFAYQNINRLTVCVEELYKKIECLERKTSEIEALDTGLMDRLARNLKDRQRLSDQVEAISILIKHQKEEKNKANKELIQTVNEINQENRVELQALQDQIDTINKNLSYTI